MNRFRFAVIGDTHYCLEAGRDMCRELPYSLMPDYQRYAYMRGTLERLAAMIGQENADLLISTGDLIEGGGDDEAETREAMALFSGVAPRFYVARGTHDKTFTLGQLSFDHRECRFILLDYLEWNELEYEKLRSALEAAAGMRRIFLFAHPPLFLWGRHFFDSPRFRQDVMKLCREYPVDIYFGGHTHNQGVSFHDGLLHAVGSAVGYPEGELVPLERFHSIIPSTVGDQYLWGVMEDSAPGYFVVDVEEDGATKVSWRSLVAGASLRIPTRRVFPSEISTPCFMPENRTLLPGDLNQVQAGFLHIFSINRGQEDGSLVRLNRMELGSIPANVSYAARRYYTLPDEVLRTLRETNEVEIRLPLSECFAVGSLSLELHLLDGRKIRTAPSPERYVCGDTPFLEFGRKYARAVCPGTVVRLKLG